MTHSLERRLLYDGDCHEPRNAPLNAHFPLFCVNPISIKSPPLEKSGGVFGGLKPNKPPVLPGEIKTLVYEKITSDDRMVVVWRPHYQVSKEVINMERNEVNHSAHSTWRCQYHIVFAPKFRRKAIYGQLKVRRKESGNHRSGGMCRPHPYARKYSTASNTNI